MLFRRDLEIPALTVMSLIIIYEVIGVTVAFAALSFFSIIFSLVIRYRGASSCIFLITGCMLGWICLAHLLYIDNTDRILPGLDGQSARVQGKVMDIQLKKKTEGNRLLMEVEVDELSGQNVRLHKNERVLINCSEDDFVSENGSSDFGAGIVPGDRISALGKLRLPEQKRNPNTFDYRKYLRTKGIYTTMYAEKASRIGLPSTGFSGRLYRTKIRFIDQLEIAAGQETSDLMRAILFGDKGSLDDDLQETFRMNGTAHILAVSGLHVGMVYALLLTVWNWLGRMLPVSVLGRRGWGFLITVGLLLVMYATLSGFAPSVVRAVLMILLHIFATLTGRYYDLKSVTMAVFLAALLVDPLILFQGGFQMSFMAILTLSIVMPYMRSFLSGSLLAGVSIQAGLMPYTIYQLNWLSIPSALINLPVIFLAGILVPLGMLSFGMSLITGGLGKDRWAQAADLTADNPSDPLIQMMDRSIDILCDIMVRLNEACCIEGLTAIRVCSPPVWTVFAFYLGLVAFASESGRLRIKRLGKMVIIIQAAVILAVSLMFGAAVDDGYRKMDLVFVDVGQGDCMHLRTEGRNYLIDGGGSDDYDVGTKILRPYLLKNGVRTVDAAFVTHLHTDHYRGICELARQGMVGRIFVYDANRLKTREICEDTGLGPEKISFLYAGQEVRLSRNTTIEVLSPDRKSDYDYQRIMEDEEDENSTSLILKANIRGVSLLATGDLGEEGESRLIQKTDRPSVPATGRQWAGDHKLHADVLKVGHHGSRFSSSDGFLDAVSPDLAVIQVGKGNTYGHPTPEVLKRLATRSIHVLRNDAQGAVAFAIRDGRITGLKTMLIEQETMKNDKI